jgi:hypothetical protein
MRANEARNSVDEDTTVGARGAIETANREEPSSTPASQRGAGSATGRLSFRPIQACTG